MKVLVAVLMLSSLVMACAPAPTPTPAAPAPAPAPAPAQGLHGRILDPHGRTVAGASDPRLGKIDIVLVTHLHGDHFGGIPFFILDAQFSGRTQPLVLVGPAGVKSRVEETMEAHFPGSSPVRRKFEIAYVEWKEREAVSLGSIQVTPWPVIHPSGGQPFALRIEAQGKVIGYSGDTEWTDALVHVAQETDLFICESYTYEKRIKFHLNYQALREHRNQLGCRRLFLTHMSEEMLSKVQGIESEIAEDGMQVSL